MIKKYHTVARDQGYKTFFLHELKVSKENWSVCALQAFQTWSNIYAWDRSCCTRAVSGLTHNLFLYKFESFVDFYAFCLFASDKSKRFYNIDYCMTDYESSEGLHYTCFCDPPSKVRLFFFFSLSPVRQIARLTFASAIMFVSIFLIGEPNLFD